MVSFLIFYLLPLILTFTFANDNISKVYIVFSNHFDNGYTLNQNGSTSGAVINQYFHEHFPKAIAVANEVRAQKGKPYKWMTQSWLVDVYRNCNATRVNTLGPKYPSDLKCPNASAIQAFEEAVKRGDINWHAFPFNAEPELFTPELFDAALNLTFAQDAYFGHAPRKTLSQRDVPGLTRNAIPLLSKRGVLAVSVGENSQVAPSAVPPIFLWHDNNTNTEVIAMYHALGYGGAWPATYAEDIKNNIYNELQADGTTIPILRGDLATSGYDDGPGIHISTKTGKVYGNASRAESCVEVPTAGVALCYAWKVDNSGPHTYFGLNLVFEIVGSMFPKATEIIASDGFDDFVSEVWQHRGDLPVVSAEIGDTWVFGADADPLKIGLFRAASRIHSRCSQKNNCILKSNGDVASFRAFERLMMIAGEHTWGWNGGHIKTTSWENEELQKSLKTDQQFRTAVVGWKEQRAILRNALASLPINSVLFNEIKSSWEEIEGEKTRERFNIDSMHSVLPFNKTSCGIYDISIGSDGSIVGLIDNSDDGNILADIEHPLAKLWYQGMDADFFRVYVKQYIAGVSDIWPELTAEGLYKPGLRSPAISSNGTVTSIKTDGTNKVVITVSFLKKAHEDRGAPVEAQIEHTCGDGGSDADISTTIRWFNKTATHMPETIWMSNVPIQSADKDVQVMLDKIGQPINAMDVDLGCNGLKHLTCGVHLHGVGDKGVLMSSTTSSTTSSTRIVSLDSALVSIGVASPVPTPLVAPDISLGIHYALVGNIWNTNYPFWYPFDDKDTTSQFRFQMNFSKKIRNT